MRIIADVYKPTSGFVDVNGVIAPILQLGTGFQGDLDARDNILMNGMLLGFSKSEIHEKIEKIIQYAELEKFVNMKLKYFSAGMRTRLAFSTVLQLNSDILLIDEVLSVGDINFRKKCFESILLLKKQGKTILFTSHSFDTISKICDKVLLLHKGKLIMIGNPDEVMAKYREISKKD